jgi:glycosyltransferase involved in cell wall biosynthesis
VRIAHVSDCYLPRLGGIERQVHDLATRQRDAGHEVDIITSVAATDASEPGRVLIHRPGEVGGDPLAIRYLSSAMGRDRVLAGGYDVVHLHASTFSPLTFLTAATTAALDLPMVITVHSLWSYASPLFRLADIPLRWRKWPLIWSAVSSAAADPLCRMLGPDVPVAQLPNGVDAEAWRIEPMSRTPGRVAMVSVMRLARRKRPRQLIEMLRLVRDRVPDDIELELVIIGDGPLRSSLHRAIDRHGMSDWVRLMGPASHDEIREVYRHTDLYIAPATLESFGIAALEARCAGLPVIAHAKTGVRDFITHGREGLLAKGDRDMVSCIAQLATSPLTLQRIHEHNLTTAPAVSWSDVLNKCEELYDAARTGAAVKGAQARASFDPVPGS